MYEIEQKKEKRGEQKTQFLLGRKKKRSDLKELPKHTAPLTFLSSPSIHTFILQRHATKQVHQITQIEERFKTSILLLPPLNRRIRQTPAQSLRSPLSSGPPSGSHSGSGGLFWLWGSGREYKYGVVACRLIWRQKGQRSGDQSRPHTIKVDYTYQEDLFHVEQWQYPGWPKENFPKLAPPIYPPPLPLNKRKAPPKVLEEYKN
ncbi:MAG: hypothetical protein Q4D91_13715 [Lautropia sp.]|nr:hypothetical protein [Lautropia sp.]